MNRILGFISVLVCACSAAAAENGRTIATGMKNPESVTVSSDGRIFVSAMGDFDKDGDGIIHLIRDGKVETFASGLDNPKGIVAFQQYLFVTDKKVVRRIALKDGKSEIYADTKDFPKPLTGLNDVAVDEFGTLYVSDEGTEEGGGAIYRIPMKFPPKKKGAPAPTWAITTVADSTKGAIKRPNGLLVDSLFHLLVLDFKSGELNRIRLSDGMIEKVADGFVGGDGLCWDRFGRLYITSWSQSKVWSIPRPGEKPVLMPVTGLGNTADLCLNSTNNKELLIPDMKNGTLMAFPAQPPGWEVDETPFELETSIAFGDVKWTDWDPSETGKVVPLRPIFLTHAGDNSGRTFMATQQGVIHIITPGSKETKIFMDIQDKVFYSDNENEQGLLGLAFHPKFKTNGEFFVFYTVKQPRLTNVVSRFRVSKNDPNKADPASEEEIFRISHRFWNHDGGTVAFGPDGFLYIVLGDGGSANDPDDNGQNLKTQLGKILRIDVDTKDGDKKYGIPKDNPFLKNPEAQPEIFALGVRNPWRLSFDRKTGQGWFGEVGQNLWEEVNLLEKGANYGWRRREAFHPFWSEGTGHKPEYTEPVWEYHHDIGKSITGGFVYRGKKFPELEGHYLYADYVTGRIWALKYDETKKRVVANRPIKDKSMPIMSFGEDEDGELYLLTYSASGKGIYGLSRIESKK